MTRGQFSQYVAREYDHLLRFVRSRVGRQQDAEDVLQRALLRLLAHCDRIDPANPQGFFFTALRNAAIDHLRKRGRVPEGGGGLLEQLGKEAPAFLPPEEEAEERGRAVVHEALSRLTPPKRRALAACWQARGDRASALAMLGLSGATKEAKYRGYDGPLFHAKRELAEALRPHQEALAALPYERLWAMICEELCGRSPDLAL